MIIIRNCSSLHMQPQSLAMLLLALAIQISESTSVKKSKLKVMCSRNQYLSCPIDDILFCDELKFSADITLSS